MALQADSERFKQLYQAQQYAEALAVLEKLIVATPQSAPLYWHQANCLEKLERHAEVPRSLNALLQRKADYVPALLKRVEYSHWELEAQAPLPDDDRDFDADNPPAAVQAARAAREQAERQLAQRNEQDLRQVLAQEPGNARACYLLANLLRYRNSESGEAEPAAAEARQLLDKAITLAPDNTEYLMARAENERNAAMVDMSLDGDEPPESLDPALVQTFSGMRYRREALENAIADYEKCWAIDQNPRYALKLGALLHDLGRYEEALSRYDAALALMPEDDPRRDFIQEMRARSENNGAGEREQMAKLLLSGLNNESGKDRNQQDDMAAQAIMGTVEAIRRGESVSTAIASNISDDPDTMVAMNVARQILNVANEPPPGLVPIAAQDFPAYQRKHCDRVAGEAQRLGLIPMGDAEALGMFNMLGQHVMLRFFRDETGGIGMASFTMKPKWPGLLGFLFLLLTGKWKAHQMIECVTQFEDGALISTQPDSISPFEYGGKVTLLKLPTKATVAQIYQAHATSVAAYCQAHPQASPMKVLDLPGIDARWVAGQQAKAAYRKSIGYVTDTELKKMLGGNYERFAEKVMTQIRRMAP